MKKINFLLAEAAVVGVLLSPFASMSQAHDDTSQKKLP